MVTITITMAESNPCSENCIGVKACLHSFIVVCYIPMCEGPAFLPSPLGVAPKTSTNAKTPCAICDIASDQEAP